MESEACYGGYLLPLTGCLLLSEVGISCSHPGFPETSFCFLLPLRMLVAAAIQAPTRQYMNLQRLRDLHQSEHQHKWPGGCSSCQPHSAAQYL